MPRFSLRTLVVVMLLGGPAIAAIWAPSNQIPSLGVLFGVLLFLIGSCVFVATFVVAAAAFAGVLGAITGAAMQLFDAFSGPKD